MNKYQDLLNIQKEFFYTDTTKTFEWRMDQLNRMERFLTENQEVFCAALHKDFGKPPFEQLFEITVPLGVVKYYKENLEKLMQPEEVAIPKGLENTGTKASYIKNPTG
ncbi:hypothetical protein ACTJIJ_21240 [Niabella sp. 22666]|uniref:hypothetical protein n=1 Tax=Niabella sp. 22666 TaxID=3453954 RepID=UPI003F8745E0